MVAGDAGCYANSIEGRARIKVCIGCAAEHDPLRRVPRNWLQRNRMAETVVEEAARKDLFGDTNESTARTKYYVFMTVSPLPSPNRKWRSVSNG